MTNQLSRCRCLFPLFRSTGARACWLKRRRVPPVIVDKMENLCIRNETTHGLAGLEC